MINDKYVVIKYKDGVLNVSKKLYRFPSTAEHQTLVYALDASRDVPGAIPSNHVILKQAWSDAGFVADDGTRLYLRKLEV